MTATAIAKPAPKIEYSTAPLRAIKIEEVGEKGVVQCLSIEDRKFYPTSRFWTSLCSTYSTHGLSTKVFKLFSHQEVLQRLTDVLGGDDKARIRFTFEDKGTTPGNILAVTLPSKPVIPYERINETLSRFNALTIDYSGGIVRSTHTPNHMADFKIAGDGFAHQYVLETPIDGFGSPLIYLSLLRQVCSNGMIGYSRGFRSEISMGRGDNQNANVIFSLERALDSFSNEEGYSDLRQRFEKATQSWASIAECNRVYKVLAKMAEKGMFLQEPTEGAKLVNRFATRREAVIGDTGTPEGSKTSAQTVRIMRAYAGMTGDLCSIYGLTHLDALSRKKMQQLPAHCSMYDLLNFTTEVATHHCEVKNGRLLQAEVGNFVSSEYDLEGSKESKEQFADWFTDVSDIPPTSES
ncbi:MAG: hypothetical protein WC919_02045 [Candidatus Paceibacterota bacterium]|jgi:hypothetical protein